MAINVEGWVQVKNGTLAVWDGVTYKEVVVGGNEYQVLLQQSLLWNMLHAFKFVVEREIREEANNRGMGIRLYTETQEGGDGQV